MELAQVVPFKAKSKVAGLKQVLSEKVHAGVMKIEALNKTLSGADKVAAINKTISGAMAKAADLSNKTVNGVAVKVADLNKTVNGAVDKAINSVKTQDVSNLAVKSMEPMVLSALNLIKDLMTITVAIIPAVRVQHEAKAHHHR